MSDTSIDAVARWLRLREEHGFRYPESADQLVVQMRHSALLDRLLQGKEPLPEPPPKAFSYPWYGLIEQGCDVTDYLWYHEFSRYGGRFGTEFLNINQTLWPILETVVPGEEWIASYVIPDRDELLRQANLAKLSVDAYLDRLGADVPTRLASTRWRVKHVGTPFYIHANEVCRQKHNNGEYAKIWKISREE